MEHLHIERLRLAPAGRFELRPAEYRLLLDGEVAALGSRALDLLLALAARPGELLSKSELLDIVWPSLVVEEGNLRVQVNSLRRVLGDDAIATVPGRGDRCCATALAQSDAATAAAVSAPEQSAAQVVGAAPGQRLLGALALMIDRIAAADARFEVAPASLPLLASLCRQLDGLPLALEVAAARVPLMGLQAVHEALAERFALLSRGRHASVVMALTAPSDTTALWFANMGNVREAFQRAREHDLALAVQLSARAAVVLAFSVWRLEVTDWVVSLQAAIESAAGQSLPPPLQALWWSKLAYLLSLKQEPNAASAARRAVELWRNLDNATELKSATVTWVRALAEPGAELDATCLQLREVFDGGTRARLGRACAGCRNQHLHGADFHGPTCRGCAACRAAAATHRHRPGPTRRGSCHSTGGGRSGFERRSRGAVGRGAGRRPIADPAQFFRPLKQRGRPQ